MDVCIPTMNCYDLLQRCVNSVLEGTVVPDRILVVDNGGKLDKDIFSDVPQVEVFTPPENMGVAATWNWFIAHTTGARVICNDDIIFARDTLEKMTQAIDDGRLFVHGNNTTGGFSLFALADEAINQIGLFDETISPKYAYYEDNDYAYRLKLVGIERFDVDTAIFHTGSATLRRYTAKEEQEHWRKFYTAKMNYIAKWGGEPSSEKFVVPFGKDAP